MKTKPITRLSLLLVTAALLFVQTACGRTATPTRPPDQSHAIKQAAVPTSEVTRLADAALPTPLPASTPTLKAAMSGDQPLASLGSGEDILNQAVRVTQGVYPRIVIAVMQNASQSDATQMRIENAAPGKGHLTVEQGGVMLMEVIVITPTLYMKQTGSDWTTLQGDQAMAYGDLFTEVIDMKAFRGDVDAGARMTVQPAGQEAVNGVEADIYDLEAKLSDGSMSTGKIWVSVQDMRILQLSIQTSTGISLQQRYEYNTPVQVEAPIAGQTPQNVPDLSRIDLCQAVSGDLVSGVLGRALVSDPHPFEDSYLGKGCQYDGGSDGFAAYFAYISLAPLSSFDETYQTGYKVNDVPGLGMQTFTVNGADAEQLWIKLSGDSAFVIAIGDVPNPDGAKQIALYYLSLIGQ